MAKKPIDYAKTFDFYGVPLTATHGDHTGQCPFCDKEDHLGVIQSTGQWQCVKCGESGNIYSFLRKIHEQCLETTIDAEREHLSSHRGISVITLKRFGVVFYPRLDRWLVPVYNQKGNITNLYVWFDGLISGAGLKAGLFNLQSLKKQKTVYICEGEWDCMAWDKVIRGLKMAKDVAVLGVHGARNFNKTYTKLLAGRDVILLLDNDADGMEGQIRANRIMAAGLKRPASVQAIEWNGDYPEGFDIKDLVADKGVKKSYSYVNKHLILGSKSKVKVFHTDYGEYEDNPCTTFDDLEEYFSSSLHWTEPLHDTLAVMLATTLGVHMGGDGLWLYVVGPPSSGKTTLAECIYAHKEHTYALSSLTGIVSGYKDENGETVSLLKDFQGKTVVIKDLTLLLSQAAIMKDRVYGELRDAYDGHFSARYRNSSEDQVYEGVNFGLLACVTDEIRAEGRSTLGERFVAVEIFDEETDTNKQIDASMHNVVSEITARISSASNNDVTEFKAVEADEASRSSVKKAQRKQATASFIDHKINQVMIGDVTVPAINNLALGKINALSQIAAFARANVTKNKDGSPTYRPRVEVGSRLASQLVKLSLALGLVFDKPVVDKAILRIISKVAFDTCRGINLELLQCLADEKEYSIDQIAASLNISRSATIIRLKDLQLLNAVEHGKRANNSGFGGRDLHIWRLTEPLEEAFNLVEHHDED